MLLVHDGAGVKTDVRAGGVSIPVVLWFRLYLTSKSQDGK